MKSIPWFKLIKLHIYGFAHKTSLKCLTHKCQTKNDNKKKDS